MYRVRGELLTSSAAYVTVFQLIAVPRCVTSMHAPTSCAEPQDRASWRHDAPTICSKQVSIWHLIDIKSFSVNWHLEDAQGS